MAVATGVVADDPCAAVVAGVDVAAQGRGAAAGQGREGAALGWRQGGAIPGVKGGAVLADNVGDLQGRLGVHGNPRVRDIYGCTYSRTRVLTRAKWRPGEADSSK